MVEEGVNQEKQYCYEGFFTLFLIWLKQKNKKIKLIQNKSAQALYPLAGRLDMS